MDKRRELKLKSKRLEEQLSIILNNRIDYLYLQQLLDLRVQITQKIQSMFQTFKLETSVSTEKDLKIWENFLYDSEQCIKLASIQSTYLLLSPKRSFENSQKFIEKLDKNTTFQSGCIRRASKYIDISFEEEQRIRKVHMQYSQLQHKFQSILNILNSDLPEQDINQNNDQSITGLLKARKML